MGMKNTGISVVNPLGRGMKVGVKTITGEIEVYLWYFISKSIYDILFLR